MGARGTRIDQRRLRPDSRVEHLRPDQCRLDSGVSVDILEAYTRLALSARGFTLYDREARADCLANVHGRALHYAALLRSSLTQLQQGLRLKHLMSCCVRIYYLDDWL